MGKRKYPYCPNGGLTLVPMPGYEGIARRVAEMLHERSKRDDRKTTPVDIVVPNFGLRDSKEPFLPLGKKSLDSHDVFVIASGPGTYKMRGQLNLLLWYLQGRKAGRIVVVTMYFPLGRSDTDEGQDILALVPFAVNNIVSNAGPKLRRILTFNLHSSQGTMSAGPRSGLLTDINLIRRVLQEALNAAKEEERRVVILLPDDGAAKSFEKKLYRLMQELEIEIPILRGLKRRSSSKSSKILGIYGDVEAARGSTVIIIDDEIAGGGTMTGSANKLLSDEFGASEVWAAVIHGVLNESSIPVFSDPLCPIKKVFFTNTIAVEPRPELLPLIESGRLQVVPVEPDLASIVYFEHWNENIREER